MKTTGSKLTRIWRYHRLHNSAPVCDSRVMQVLLDRHKPMIIERHLYTICRCLDKLEEQEKAIRSRRCCATASYCIH